MIDQKSLTACLYAFHSARSSVGICALYRETLDQCPANCVFQELFPPGALMELLPYAVECAHFEVTAAADEIPPRRLFRCTLKATERPACWPCQLNPRKFKEARTE